MNSDEILKENDILKEKICVLEKELILVKHKLNTYQTNSKKYYEKHKEKIKEKNLNYKKDYKPTEDQKRLWARTAYLKKKEKLQTEIL
jgi:hypothetical protein